MGIDLTSPRMKQTRLTQLSSWFLLLLVPLCAWGYPPPAPLPGEPTSAVDPAVQQLRRDMLDPEINSLTFHNMDQLFTTRSSAALGPGVAAAARRP